MPPIIGAAMRCMTSAPVPRSSMIGSRPARITATVIAFGRTRSTAPSWMAVAAASPAIGARLPPARASQALLQVEQHHHAELGRDAGQRDEADRRATDRLWPSSQMSQKPPTSANGSVGHDQQRLVEAAEGQVEQHEDDGERDRHDELEPSPSARSRYSNWPDQEIE